MLKIAWERGYLMYKFYKYDHIPPPNEAADPIAIMDRMVAKQTENLGTNIEVFLQRVVSLVTEEEPTRKSLSLYGDSVISIIEH